jgi:methylenetetrahydrofolate dehydrogenase (NADP+)/methenyltetrahydrofolate cyclohydrolase
MPKILDGTALSKKIKASLKRQIKGKNISLATILVGDDPASKIYVNLKHKDCAEVGIKSVSVNLPATVSQKRIIDEIKKLNKSVTGYIVQMPLPQKFDTKKIIENIDPLKDADGIHPYNLGSFDNPNTPKPCTPLGIVTLLKEHNVKLEGKNILVIGRSKTVGIPVSLLLLKENATVTIAHSKTVSLAKKILDADVIIAAAGSQNLVKRVKKGAVIVDVGVSRDKKTGKVLGDVSKNAYKNAAWVSKPVGGVGPMTRVMLLQNVVSLKYKNKH